MNARTNEFPVPSLIQGISQQARQSRGQSSAEDQQNCINDLLLGARARNGTKIISNWVQSPTRPFFHQIERSQTENYLFMVTSGSLEIINLKDGVKATINGDPSAYLTHTEISEETFCAATLEDVTFIANKSVVPAMAAATSPARANEGIAHFKSAGYSTNYKLIIQVNGATYTAAYKTPDNSVSTNADFIATNVLAENFKNAVDAIGIPNLSVDRYGSVLRIRSTAGTPVRLSTEDGLGGEQFIAFSDRAKTFSDLPNACWNGFTVAIGSTEDATTTDHYLKYVGENQEGYWEEVVAPATKTSLDASTMPLAITNIGLNEFTVGAASWGDRIAGDGVDSAKDPSFIGREIQDLQFINRRLVIITEATFVYSRSGNAYVYFPDTVQTSLDTAPIDYEVTNGKITLIRHGVVVSEHLYLWAHKVQLKVASGNENLTEETVEAPPATSYEYDGKVAPKPFGLSSLIFTTSRGIWNNVTEVIYRNGAPSGELNLTGHCPKLLKGEVKDVYIGEASKLLFASTTGILNECLLYQWYDQGSDRVQSAWNRWTMPATSEILWIGMEGSKVYFIIKWANSMTLEVLETEYEGDEPDLIPLRADHRVDESTVTQVEEDHVLITTPYEISQDDLSLFTAYERLDDDTTGEQRGRVLAISWVDNTTIRIDTNLGEDARFWFGAIVDTRRKFSELYITSERGTTLLETVNINRIVVSHTNTGYYRIVSTPRGSDPSIDIFSSRDLGNPDIKNNRLYVEPAGEFESPIGYLSNEVEIELINDSILPSSWDNMKYLWTGGNRTR